MPSFLPSYEEFTKTYAREKRMPVEQVLNQGDTQKAYNDLLILRRKTQNMGDISQYVAGFSHKTDYNRIHVGKEMRLAHNNKLLYFTAPSYNKYDKVYASNIKSQYGTAISGENQRKWVALGVGDNNNSFRPYLQPPGKLYGGMENPYWVKRTEDFVNQSIKMPI